MSRIVTTLEREHGEISEKTQRLQLVLRNLCYEGKACRGRNLKEGDRLLAFFKGKARKHMQLEEKVLFPYLEEHVPKLDSVIRLLRADHEFFKEGLRDLEKDLRKLSGGTEDGKGTDLIAKIRESGTYLVYLVRNHLHAECESIYKVVDRELRPAERKELEARCTRAVEGRRVK